MAWQWLFGDMGNTQNLKTKNIRNEGLSIISKETVLFGDINTADNLRIDGKVTGNIESTGRTIVGLNGVVHGDICSKWIVVSGKVFGNIYASEECVVESGGFLNGNVEAKNFQTKDNASYVGNCTIIDQQVTVDKQEPNDSNYSTISSHIKSSDSKTEKNIREISEQKNGNKMTFGDSSILNNKIKQIKSTNI